MAERKVSKPGWLRPRVHPVHPDDGKHPLQGVVVHAERLLVPGILLQAVLAVFEHGEVPFDSSLGVFLRAAADFVESLVGALDTHIHLRLAR